MSQKINTPKGTRDFSSLELKKRDYLLNILKQCFKTFKRHARWGGDVPQSDTRSNDDGKHAGARADTRVRSVPGREKDELARRATARVLGGARGGAFLVHLLPRGVELRP